MINRKVLDLAVVLVLSLMLVIGLTASNVIAQTTIDPALSSISYLPFMGMGGMFGRFNPYLSGLLGGTDTTGLGYLPFMGMGGMMGRFNPYLSGLLGGTDTTGLGYLPFMGMGGMMGHFNPYLFSNIFSPTTTTTL